MHKPTPKFINTETTAVTQNADGQTAFQLYIVDIEKYYSTLKQTGKAATTIAEKLRRIREGVCFIQLNLQESDSTLYERAQRLHRAC